MEAPEEIIPDKFKRKHKTAHSVKIDTAAMIGSHEPIFTEKEILKLFKAKCDDLSIQMFPE
jgi:hypothetical protein